MPNTTCTEVTQLRLAMFKDKTIALLHRVIITSTCIACMRDNEGGLLAGMMLEEANELEAFVHMFVTQGIAKWPVVRELRSRPIGLEDCGAI